MDCYLLLLLLLLGLAGQGSADSHPEVLQAPVGSSILVQCHYRLQDVRALKSLAQERGRKQRTRKKPIESEPEVCSRTPPWTLPRVLVLTSSDGVRTVSP
uniref:Triggering receptor expressed on myeloid cells-like 1 n=1 Tax=Mus musculus TaxID=10090 RepID=A6XA73_MOUSE|nr:triggering receptor expressed on myeloid cells-like 1d [Mus musculus]